MYSTSVNGLGTGKCVCVRACVRACMCGGVSMRVPMLFASCIVCQSG